MDRPVIVINENEHEIRELKGKDWRILGEFMDKKISIKDKNFVEEQAEFIANFFEGVTAEEVLNLPLEEIFPKSVEIRDYIIKKITEKLNVAEKNVNTGGE